jgi:RNA polymerase sigma-70 factor (ECF subfamily)
MTEKADEDLVKEFVTTGSRGAFSELYERYKDKIFNTAYRIVTDYEGARDVAHDVFLIVYLEARGFRFRSSFSSWIYRITVNRSLDEARRARRRRPQLSTDAMREDLPSLRRDERPEAVAADHEAQQALLDALAALSAKLRTVITLRYFEGLSYDQIGEIIGRPVGTVKSRLRRAHRKLGRILTIKGYDRNREARDGMSQSQ